MSGRRLLGVCVLVLLGYAVACGGESPAQPNIVVILSDTHRFDYVGWASRSGFDLTPNLRRLARDGVRYSRFYTVIPISAPAYASLLTGLTPLEHGLLNNQQPLPPSVPVLPARLRAAGYTTAAVVSNVYCASAHGFSRGFDSFWDAVDGTGKEGVHVTDAAIAWLDRRDRAKPFFLFLAYMDAHTPYIHEGLAPCMQVRVNDEPPRRLTPENVHVANDLPLHLPPGETVVRFHFLVDGQPAEPPESASPLRIYGLHTEPAELPFALTHGWEETASSGIWRLQNEAELTIRNDAPTPVDAVLSFRAVRDYTAEEHRQFYLAGVQSVDHEVGRLLDELQRRGLYDDAAIVFLSDHGEMLGEHGSRGHIDSLYEEDVHCPLIIKRPGAHTRGVSTEPLSISELYPRIASMAGMSPPAAKTTAGSGEPDHFLPLMTFPPEAERLRVGVIDGPYKLLGDGKQEAFELYDLRSDPTEQIDLYDERADTPRVMRMREYVRTLAEHGVRAESLDLSDLSPEQVEQLRALGYVQ